MYHNRTQVQATGSNTKQINKELSGGCAMYDPCPICFKCQNKASHLYERCINCAVQFCGHNHKQRSMIIRRENFAIKITDSTGREFLKLSEQAKAKGE